MELTDSQFKKLQTIGKRLCSTHQGVRTQLNKYHVIDNVGYFTNTHVAFKFKNGILKEDIPVSPFEQSDGYPEVARLFDGFPKGEEVKISVKDLLQQIRKERTNYKNGRWIECLNKSIDKGLIHLVVDEQTKKVELIKGAKQGAFNVDYKNLYETLLMADSLKIKEMTCYFHDGRRKDSINIRPMLLEGEKMDALLCPVRIA
jgi:hypothetical protein